MERSEIRERWEERETEKEREEERIFPSHSLPSLLGIAVRHLNSSTTFKEPKCCRSDDVHGDTITICLAGLGPAWLWHLTNMLILHSFTINLTHKLHLTFLRSNHYEWTRFSWVFMFLVSQWEEKWRNMGRRWRNWFNSLRWTKCTRIHSISIPSWFSFSCDMRGKMTTNLDQIGTYLMKKLCLPCCMCLFKI